MYGNSGIHGFPWISGKSGFPDYPVISRIFWKLMNIPGYPWISMDFYEYPRISMDFHEYLKYHGFPVETKKINKYQYTHAIFSLYECDERICFYRLLDPIRVY